MKAVRLLHFNKERLVRSDMEQNKKSFVDSLVVGAALFSMFFGAGNMIFPPYLGLQTGSHWALAFGAYYLADIGLALVTLVVLIRNRGYEAVLAPAGHKLSLILMSLIVLCLGPFIAIPRTAATTYELSVIPLLGDRLPTVVFCVLFFLIVLLLSINENSVVDIVGKVLTPLLFVGLLVLIFLGILHPLGPADTAAQVENVVAAGTQSGYQTMDALASLLFGAIIFNSVANRGHKNPEDQMRVSLKAGLIAGLGLFIVYLGLTYLGATASTLYPASMDRTQLLICLIQELIPGQLGVAFFGVVVCLACLTTSIALTSSAGDYFSSISGGKLSYKSICVAVCIFSAAVSSIGTETIIAFASPILSILYPPMVVLVFSSFLGKHLGLWGHRAAALAACLCGCLEVLAGFGLLPNYVALLPLGELGFGWLLPTLAAGLVGHLLSRKKA